MNLILEPDSAKIFGVHRSGSGTLLYTRIVKHDPCSYCGEPAPEWGCEVDHIHSRFKGGENHWTNYTAACRFCNITKYNMVLGHLYALRCIRTGELPALRP